MNIILSLAFGYFKKQYLSSDNIYFKQCRSRSVSTLTKSDMIEHLMDQLSLTRQEGRCLVENFFDELSDSLIEGREVKLSGFGNFELKDKNTRPGRNPKTGEAVNVSARRVVTFKTGQKFRQKVDARLFEA